MARGRRASKEWAEPPKLEADTFRRFVRTVGTARSRLNDANMKHAGEWKKAEPLGIHPQAAKLFCRLDDMEDTKRKDFLRAFDTYRDWADWAAQADMLEGLTATAQQTAETAGGGDSDGADDSAGQPAEPMPEREPLPDNVEVEADVGEDTAAEATEELANAGFTFAAGRQAAALEGVPAEANPHPETSPAYPIWARGHAQGLRDQEEAANADQAESGVVPLNGGRRSRRAAAEAQAVH